MKSLRLELKQNMFFSHQKWCLFLLASLYRFGYLEMRVSLSLLTEGTSKILWGHSGRKHISQWMTWNWCSSHSIYLHIYHKNQPHVAKYASPMDGMGLFQGCFMFQYSWCRFQMMHLAPMKPNGRVYFTNHPKPTGIPTFFEGLSIETQPGKQFMPPVATPPRNKAFLRDCSSPWFIN